MISNRRSARRMIIQLLSLSPPNSNTRLITGCRGHPCPRKRETRGGFHIKLSSVTCRRAAQQSISRHREENGQVDRRSRDQRRVRMVGKIRRGVGEVLYIDEVEQERRADDRINRSEKFALQCDRNQEYQRIVEVPL